MVEVLSIYRCPRVEEEIDEKADVTGEVHRKKCWLLKDIILYGMNEENLKLMNNGISRNVLRFHRFPCQVQGKRWSRGCGWVFNVACNPQL